MKPLLLSQPPSWKTAASPNIQLQVCVIDDNEYVQFTKKQHLGASIFRKEHR